MEGGRSWSIWSLRPNQIAFRKSCFEWKLYAGQHEICHPASLSNIEVANLSRIFKYAAWKQLKNVYWFLGLQPWGAESSTEQIVQTANSWASNWFCILGSVTPGSLLTAPNTNRQKTKYKYQNAKTNTNFYLSGSFTPWAGPAWVPPDHQTKYQQTRGFPSTHPLDCFLALENIHCIVKFSDKVF